MCKLFKNRVVLTVLFCGFSVLGLHAEQLPYLCDFGVQGGLGYYIGDAQGHPFMMPREVYGGQFRYKFNNRWALQVKGQYQKIAYKYPIPSLDLPNEPAVYTNDMVNVDVVGEFNFFRYGEKTNDTRIKPITPYIFLGVGGALFGEEDEPYGRFAVYFPFGISKKYHFAPRWQLLVAWQHNLYFTDILEKFAEYGNTHNLNGTNFLNNDLTGQLTLGVVFEFARQKGSCKTCSWN